eukprot:3058889-Amphidinium_carterae.1
MSPIATMTAPPDMFRKSVVAKGGHRIVWPPMQRELTKSLETQALLSALLTLQAYSPNTC